MSELTLRRATPEDSAVLLRWRNDPETVANSISRKPIDAGEHALWLARMLASNSHVLYVALLEGEPIGTGRLEFLGPAVELSLTVAPERRGLGVGGRLVLALVREAEALGYGWQVAQVRENNAASMIAFLKAGFRPDGDALLRLERRIWARTS